MGRKRSELSADFKNTNTHRRVFAEDGFSLWRPYAHKHSLI